MWHLYIGEDFVRSYSEAKLHGQRLADTKSASLAIVEADEISNPNQLWEKIAGVSLFSKPEVVLLKRALKNKPILEFLTDKQKQLTNIDLLLWEDDKVDGRLKLVKELDRLGASHHYGILKDPEMLVWVRNEAKARGLQLKEDQIQLIAQSSPGFTGIALQNLTKLDLYGTPIPDEVLVNLVSTTDEADMWAFLDALSAGNKPQALLNLRKLMEFEDNSQYIISMLSRELKLLAQVLFATKHKVNLTTLGIHQFVLKKLQHKATRFNWDKVNRLSQALIRLDTSIKQGKVDSETGLFLMVLSW